MPGPPPPWWFHVNKRMCRNRNEMSEAVVFSYFYFTDEYLSISSPSEEANLPPSFITFLKIEFIFLTPFKHLWHSLRDTSLFPCPIYGTHSGSSLSKDTLFIYLLAWDNWKTRSTVWKLGSPRPPITDSLLHSTAVGLSVDIWNLKGSPWGILRSLDIRAGVGWMSHVSPLKPFFSEVTRLLGCTSLQKEPLWGFFPWFFIVLSNYKCYSVGNRNFISFLRIPNQPWLGWFSWLEHCLITESL